MCQDFDLVIIGGGAAGFFTAINCAENYPFLKIAILERGKDVLQKVKISGGGRCNITHSCFETVELVKFYPRGEKELRGPFCQFSPFDMIQWLDKQNVKIKTEPDGRIFPETNSSQTIIDCFVRLARKFDVKIITEQSVKTVNQSKNYWDIETQNKKYTAQKIVFATGNNPKIWKILENLNHKIVPPVPSLFTFNSKNKIIETLMGVSAQVHISVTNSKLASFGSILITHWGLSGPAILKLSAWGAREFFDKNYQFSLLINWLNEIDNTSCIEILKNLKQELSKKIVSKKSPFEISNRLWEQLVLNSEINSGTKWADLNKNQIQNLTTNLTKCEIEINGKSTFKEEFVTAGGIDLKEINFKTMESKLHKNLYFTGEVVNIDALTGGFNFQNAWTSGFIVAKNLM